MNDSSSGTPAVRTAPAAQAKAGGGQKSFLFGFLFVSALAVASAILCYLIEGPEVFGEVLASEGEFLLDVVPRVGAGIFLVGFLTVLIPPEPIAKLLGEGSGIKGLLIATVAGIATPGGPWVIFPIVTLFSRSGADLGACVTYVTAWGLLGFQRLLVWEIAFLGTDVSLVRYSSGLIVPVVAGLLARRFLSMIERPRADGS